MFKWLKDKAGSLLANQGKKLACSLVRKECASIGAKVKAKIAGFEQEGDLDKWFDGWQVRLQGYVGKAFFLPAALKSQAAGIIQTEGDKFQAKLHEAAAGKAPDAVDNACAIAEALICARINAL